MGFLKIMAQIKIAEVRDSKFTEGASYCKFIKTAGDSIGLTSTKNMGWAEVNGKPEKGAVVLNGEECDNYTRSMVLMLDDKGKVKRRPDDGGAMYTYKFHAVGMEGDSADVARAMADAMEADILANPNTEDRKEADKAAAKAEATAG